MSRSRYSSARSRCRPRACRRPGSAATSATDGKPPRGEDHRRHRGDQQQLDDPRLGQGDVGPDGAQRRRRGRTRIAAAGNADADRTTAGVRVVDGGHGVLWCWRQNSAHSTRRAPLPPAGRAMSHPRPAPPRTTTPRRGGDVPEGSSPRRRYRLGTRSSPRTHSSPRRPERTARRRPCTDHRSAVDAGPTGEREPSAPPTRGPGFPRERHHHHRSRTDLDWSDLDRRAVDTVRGAGHGRRAEGRQRPPRHGDEPGPGRLPALPEAHDARPRRRRTGPAATGSSSPAGTPASPSTSSSTWPATAWSWTTSRPCARGAR